MRFPPLDSPHQEHSLEPQTSDSRLFQAQEPWLYFIFSYRHAITKRIPPLDPPRQDHSFEPLNLPFQTISSLLTSFFYCTRLAEYDTLPPV